MVAPLDTPQFGPMPPYGRHAITIHVPGWDTIVRFGNRDMSLISQFKSFYPRLKLHPDVTALVTKCMEKSGIKGLVGFPFPLQETAEECVAFATSPARGENVCKADELSFRLFRAQTKEIWIVFFPTAKMPALLPFWQNVGMGISSRFAEDCMREIAEIEEIPLPITGTQTVVKEGPAHQILRDRISSLLNRAPIGPPREEKVAADDVYLFQSGMSSIYTIHKYLLGKFNSKTVLFGFAFHSTPHVLEDFGPGLNSFRRGDAADLDQFEVFLKEEAKEGRKIQALWAEFPANPILLSPDLGRLRKLADQYGFLLVVDDTIASFCNVDLMGVADIVVTSLTKSFNGYADLLAASAVLSPASSRYQELKAMMDENFKNVFYEGDAKILEKNSRDYMERSKILNNNAEKLVEYLDGLAKDPKSSVAKVYYPITSDSLDYYKQYMRAPTEDFTPGYGCLFSLELDTVEATIACYNNLHIHQGPHLGAHLTLALPYVKGMYAKELDSIAEFGLNERQLRVSVGLEDSEALIEVFKHALTFADAVKEESKSVTLH